MFTNMDNERNNSEFWPRATSSPSSHSARHIKQEALRSALTPSSTYVKYGANDLELTTSNVRLIATPTRSQLEPSSASSTGKKRQASQRSILAHSQDMEKILRKINSSIMKNVEKRRGCSFNSQKNMKDNLDFLKTAFRQTSGSVINEDFFDNKHSFELLCQKMTFFDSQTTKTETNAETLDMLDSMEYPALPIMSKKRKTNAGFSVDKLNFKRGLEIYLNKNSKKAKRQNQDSFISSIASTTAAAEPSNQLCSTCSTSYFISTIGNSSYLSSRSLLSPNHSTCSCSCQKRASKSFTSTQHNSYSSDRDYESLDEVQQPPFKKPILVEKRTRVNRSMTFDVKMASTPKSFRKRKDLINKLLIEKQQTRQVQAFAQVPSARSSALSLLSSSLNSASSSSTKIDHAHSYESLLLFDRNRNLNPIVSIDMDGQLLAQEKNAGALKCHCGKQRQTNLIVDQQIHEENCNFHFHHHQHNHHHHHLYFNQAQTPFGRKFDRDDKAIFNHRSSTLKRVKKSDMIETEMTKSQLVDCNGYFKQLLKMKLKNKKLENANFHKLRLKPNVNSGLAVAKPLKTSEKSDLLRIAKRHHRSERCTKQQQQPVDIRHHVRKLEAIKQRSVKSAERNMLAINNNLLDASLADHYPVHMNNNEFNQFGQFQVWWV